MTRAIDIDDFRASHALPPRFDRVLLRAFKELPSVRSLREARYERVFRSAGGFAFFRGVYRSFNEAQASAPRGVRMGFDHPAYAAEFADRFDHVFAYDYPVLFWLSPLMRPGTRVFDVGGHLGVHFHSYQRYLEFPADLEWTVCEVPALAREGRALAAERGWSQLRFTERLSDADGCDVLLSAGALQYIEAPSLASLLASLEKRPSHLLLNKLPLSDGEGFVTLQNTGPGFTPQYVFNRRDFIRDLEDLDYRLIDSWQDPTRSCRIPFHPRNAVGHYSGLYLRRQ